MAERLTVAYAGRYQIPNLRVSSAGVAAVVGRPIHPDAAFVLEELGGDASNFAARQVTSRIASEADLILTMTKTHRDAVLEIAPQQLHRTFTLIEAARLISDCNAQSIADLAAFRSHLAHELLDISDPIGKSVKFHASVGSQIAESLLPTIEFYRAQTGRHST